MTVAGSRSGSAAARLPEDGLNGGGAPREHPARAVHRFLASGVYAGWAVTAGPLECRRPHILNRMQAET
jgi:hypothetical protein